MQESNENKRNLPLSTNCVRLAMLVERESSGSTTLPYPISMHTHRSASPPFPLRATMHTPTRWHKLTHLGRIICIRAFSAQKNGDVVGGVRLASHANQQWRPTARGHKLASKKWYGACHENPNGGKFSKNQRGQHKYTKITNTNLAWIEPALKDKSKRALQLCNRSLHELTKIHLFH